MIRARISLLGIPVLAFAGISIGTRSTLAQSSTPIFQITARTVVEDVVVMDKDGHAVPGLHRRDFQVFENGKPQRITFFDSNFAATPTEAAAAPALPADTFTNVSAVPANSVTDIVLLDSLNTRSTERMYAQVQMVKYLASLPPHMRVGVFTLTAGATMIWGFNQDSSALRAAIARFASKPSPSSKPSIAAQKQGMIAAMARVKQTANETGDARLGRSADALDDFLKMGTHLENLNFHDHALITTDALQDLAHYLAGIPGRKNLFWIVDDFPTCNGCVYANLFDQTKDMLAAAGVSVYPIDANGVDANINPLAAPRLIDTEIWAEDTGGKAYHDNNIQQEIADAAEHGSRYYTLAYVPSNHKEEGRERKVEVKVLSGDYKVFYRKRYFERTRKQIAAADALPARSPLLSMMGRGMPNISELPYRLTVTPSAVPGQAATRPAELHGRSFSGGISYRVAFQLQAGDLALAPDVRGIRRKSLEVILLVYSQDGKLLNTQSHTITLMIRPSQWASALTQGVNFHVEIDAPPGDVYLRTGIYDAAQSKVGTLEVPLSAVIRQE